MENIFGHKLTIGESKFGKGIFANSIIPVGTEIFTFTGEPLSFNDAVKLGNDQCYALQIGQTDYIMLDIPFGYVNHSCNPNCGLKDNTKLIAIKNIEVGQELFYDYSTTMLERHWTMNCDCKSDNCRQVVDDFDKLSKASKEYYISLNVVPSFIIHHLENNLDDNY